MLVNVPIDFENKLVGKNITYSMIIASWNEVAKEEGFDDDIHAFDAWLQSLIIDGHPLTMNQVDEIITLASLGSVELKKNAHNFLRLYKYGFKIVAKR